MFPEFIALSLMFTMHQNQKQYVKCTEDAGSK